MSYVFISHDLAVVRAMAHRVMVMKDGDVVEEGEAQALFEAPREPYTRELLAAAHSGLTRSRGLSGVSRRAAFAELHLVARAASRVVETEARCRAHWYGPMNSSICIVPCITARRGLAATQRGQLQPVGDVADPHAAPARRAESRASHRAATGARCRGRSVTQRRGVVSSPRPAPRCAGSGAGQQQHSASGQRMAARQPSCAPSLT